MISDGLATRHGKQLTWSQLLMAANTPMLFKAGLVEGPPTRGCWPAARWPASSTTCPCAELIEAIVAEAIKHLQSAAALAQD